MFGVLERSKALLPEAADVDELRVRLVGSVSKQQCSEIAGLRLSPVPDQRQAKPGLGRVQ